MLSGENFPICTKVCLNLFCYCSYLGLGLMAARTSTLELGQVVKDSKCDVCL